MARILSGDGEAFECLVESYSTRLFQVVHGILGDHQRSEDVCQEVFVKAYLKLADFRYRSRLSTWLYRIAVNTALKHRGRHARHREVLAENAAQAITRGRLVHDDPRPSEIEGADLLEKLLRPLPPHLRAVVVLKEREGLTYREISSVLDCTQGAVEQRLHRAFNVLREVWHAREGDLGLEDGSLRRGVERT